MISTNVPNNGTGLTGQSVYGVFVFHQGLQTDSELSGPVLTPKGVWF